MKKKTPKPAKAIPEPSPNAILCLGPEIAPMQKLHRRTRYGVGDGAPPRRTGDGVPSRRMERAEGSPSPTPDRKPRVRLINGALQPIAGHVRPGTDYTLEGGVLKAVPNGVIWYGDEYIVESRTENFDGPGGGFQTVTRYIGQPDAILALREEFILNETRYSFEDNVPSVITAYLDDTFDSQAPTDNNANVQEVWNLTWAENTRRLSAAPAFNTSTAISQSVLKTEYSIDNKTLPDGTLITNVFTYNFNTAFGGTAPNQYRDARLLSTVGDVWVDRYPILVQRISQSTKGQQEASLVGINKIWRIDPKSRLNKLGNLTGWQWLKTPAEKDLYGGKITIIQRYIGAVNYPTPPFENA